MKQVYPSAGKIVKEVVEDCVKLVSKTYGPAGQKILIKDEYRLRAVDDGKIALENYELEDEGENAVISYIKEAAAKTDSRVGDGTTTAAILMGAIVREVMKKNENPLIAENPHKYVVEIKKGAEEAIAQIKENAKPIKDKKELHEVALNSSNDEEIATLISDTLFKVGKDGIINVQDSKSSKTEVEYTDGMEIEKGYASPYLINKGDKVVLENPYILLVNKKLDAISELVPVFKEVIERGNKTIMVVAEGFGDGVLANVIVNRANGIFHPLLVENPAYGEQKIEFLRDLASVTGGVVVEPKLDMKVAEMKLEHLGHANLVTATKDATIISTAKADKSLIDKRVKALKKQTDEAATDFEKDKLGKRIAALLGGVGTIKVGANTQQEQETKRLKVEDAVNATKLAFRTGVVKGAGRTFESIKTSSEILNAVLKEPRKVLEANGEEFLDTKVFDPADVLVAALESAVSIGTGLIEMAGVIAFKREKKEEPKF